MSTAGGGPVDASLAGARALVTGGTRGIGAAAADALAAAGAQVLVAARTPRDDLAHPVIAADLATADGVERVARETLGRLGGIDVLVDNAGWQIRRDRALDFTDADWQSELDIDLLSAVRMDRALAPAMIEQGSGSIVHVGSGAARTPRPASLPYSAAKAALHAYSKGLATELGPHGVRVNLVAPGFFPGPRLADIAREQGTDVPTLTDRIVADLGIPLGRPGEPGEIAALIVFLASPAASYLTGSAFAADGGAMPAL